MIGGGKGKFHKNQYGIPVGLALLNTQLKDTMNSTQNLEGGLIKEELYENYYIWANNEKMNTRTRKNKRKKKNKKT